MGITREQIREFLRGGVLPPEVVAEIERGLDEPNSLVAREARRIAEVATILASDDAPLLLDPPGAEHRQICADVKAANREFDAKYDAEEFSEALAIAEEVVRRAETLGEAHPLLALSLANLGKALNAFRRMDDARRHLERAWAIVSILPTQALTGVVANNLAVTLVRTGNHVDGIAMHTKALEYRQQVFGSLHRATAESHTSLGQTLREVGDYAGTLREYDAAKEIYDKLGGKPSKGYATLLNNLGTVRQRMGEFDAAEANYMRALEIDGTLFGVESVETAIDLGNLASLASAQGRYAAAVKLYETVIHIFQQKFGEHHVRVASWLMNLSTVHHRLENWSEAERLYDEVSAIYREAYGDQPNASLANLLTSRATLYSRKGELAKSAELHLKALDMRRQLYGEEHESVLESRANLAVVLGKLGELPVAQEQLELGLTSVRRIFPAMHPEIARMEMNLGYVYGRQDRFDAAAESIREALSIRRATLGDMHNLTAMSAGSLAIANAALGRFQEAWQLFDKTCEADEHVLQNAAVFPTDEERFRYFERMHRRREQLLTLVCQEFAADASIVGRAYDLLTRRRALEAQPHAKVRDQQLLALYPEKRSILERRAELRRDIAFKQLVQPTEKELSRHMEILKAWETELDTIERELALEIDEVRHDKLLHTAGHREVARRIPQDAILAEYTHVELCDFRKTLQTGKFVSTQSRYIVFALTASNPDQVRLIDLGDAALIDEAIAERLALTEALAADELLWAHLLEPLQKLEAHVSEIIVSRDPGFRVLDFNKLVAAQQRFGPPVAIQYVTTGLDLVAV